MSLADYESGPDSYAARAPQRMTPELEAEAMARLRRIRDAFSDLKSLAPWDRQALGYIEGLVDGLSFGVHGTQFKNHLLTLGDYERQYCASSTRS